MGRAGGCGKHRKGAAHTDMLLSPNSSDCLKSVENIPGIWGWTLKRKMELQETNRNMENPKEAWRNI